MKKQEYIEKYGEEAWKIKAEKQRAYSKAWAEKNPEKIRESKRKYDRNNAKEIYERKKPRVKEYGKKYREKNREKIKAYLKEYYINNKEKHNENSKQYRIENKEKINAHKREYAKTKRGRAQSLRHTYMEKDKEKGFNVSNNISQKWIVDNIFSGQKCVYCGDQDWTHLGCDRIDNSKPHTEDNVVCSCFICNSDRADRYTVEEFKKYRSLHPRECDMPKAPAIQLSETGALKKRAIPNR